MTKALAPKVIEGAGTSGYYFVHAVSREVGRQFLWLRKRFGLSPTQAVELAVSELWSRAMAHDQANAAALQGLKQKYDCSWPAGIDAETLCAKVRSSLDPFKPVGLTMLERRVFRALCNSPKYWLPRSSYEELEASRTPQVVEPSLDESLVKEDWAQLVRQVTG